MRLRLLIFSVCGDRMPGDFIEELKCDFGEVLKELTPNRHANVK
jgi:hypothetical protein